MQGVDAGESQVCDSCGGAAFRPATRRAQIVAWFNHGACALTAWRCRSCGAAWGRGSEYLARGPRAGRGQRLHLPLETLDALRAARGWHPPPLFYAIVGAAALLPAVAIAQLSRVRWPVALIAIPVATMIVVFLWSMATVRGGRRAILERVAPELAWRQDFAEELTMLREQVCDFRLIAPADWSGAVLLESGILRGADGDERVLDVVRVIADQGDPALDPDRHTPGWEPATPTLEIRCFRTASSFSEDAVLREFGVRASPPKPSEVGDHERDRHEADRRAQMDPHGQVDEFERPEAAWHDRWDDGRMRVDGHQAPARLLIGRDVSVASLQLDGQHTLIIADGIELSALELREVHDPAPLLDELAIRRDRMAAAWKR